jgi:hypothetical protein
MRNFFNCLSIGVLGLLGFAHPSFGQTASTSLDLPFDKSIKVGKLKNGFTY